MSTLCHFLVRIPSISRRIALPVAFAGAVLAGVGDAAADVRTPQVLINARIVETSTSFARGVGVNWSAGSDLVRTIEAAEATVNPGESAGLGEIAPIRIRGVEGTALGGLRTGIRSTIQPDGAIVLVIDYDVAVPRIVEGALTPGLRNAATSVRVGDGETFALGGLLTDDEKRAGMGTPLLGDIPILGSFFQSARAQRGETELIILVTPSIIVSGGGGQPATTAEPTDAEIDEFARNVLPRAFGFTGGFGRVETGSVGLGTRIVGADEGFLVRSDDTLDALVFGLEFESAPTTAFGKRIPFLDGARLYGSYTGWFADDSFSAEAAPGGDNVAITYFGPGPSEGIGLGATGMSGRMSADYQLHQFEFGFRTSSDVARLDVGSLTVAWEFGIAAEQAYGEYSGNVQSLTFPGIGAESRQETDDTMIGPHLGLLFGYRATERLGLDLGLSFNPLYRWSDLESRQSTFCDLCPPGEQALDFLHEEDDTGFAYRLSANLGVNYAVTDTLELSADWWGGYIDGRSVVKNPANPAEGDTFLDEDGAFDWSFRAGLTYRF